MGLEAKICYEATYLGFSLCRDLRKNGVNCDVIASSLIPELSGKRQKTDRIDAQKLVQYFATGLLTIIHVPDEVQESDRDLVRTRKFVNDQLKATKLYVKSLCRRHSINPKEEDQLKSNTWNVVYTQYLRKRMVNLPKSAQFTLETLLFQIEQLEALVKTYEQKIELLAATDRYKKPVEALKCFRGIKTTTAMTLTTEIGDVDRFNHPSKLVSYAGMDLSEYSSGGKERRYSITKLGNPHIRTALVEAAQFAARPPRLSQDLKKRRANADLKTIAIADRCMLRLHKKGSRLLMRNKPGNKVKMACARELLCFVWETLKTAA